MPPTSKGTTSAPVSLESTQRIEWSGRTQRKAPAPQRMDFGQGKARMVSVTASAITSDAARPGRSITANQTCPFLSSRASNWSLASPVERRKPSSAFSGASTRGPLRSSRAAWVISGRPVMCSTRRRGVAKAAAASYVKPASTSFSVTSRFRSSAARACIRAGISSEKSSSSRSGIRHCP